jgi:flavin reductase (DIM6/NTAB) family NADH-FMN oxidoreductase RutF
MTDESHSHDPALHLLHAPVCVIGAASAGQTAGLTAAWVTRVSLDPARLLVAVAPTRHTWAILNAAGVFSVSILGEAQVDIGRVFGLCSGRDLDKWSEVAHVLLNNEDGADVPALTDCAARLLCRTVTRVNLGDHDGFVGEIITSEIVDGAPALAMCGRDWIPDRD